MPTKTQINFRKQMKAYKKEASADKEKIFSYIENDMISDYYSIKPKRTYKKPVPVAAIMLLIFIIGVRIYNFAGTNLPNASIGITKAMSGIGSEAAPVRTASNKKLQELHRYLNDINNLKLKQNDITSQYNKSVSDFNNRIITSKGLILSIEELIRQISIISSESESIKEAEGMELYHSMFKEGINLQSSLFEAILLKQKTGKAKYNDDINKLKSKIDTLDAGMMDEMITKFDELGIEYHLNSEGGITYTIRY
ncbi:MAG TPA: hypothetical protein PLS45_07990 [Bacillota bacterium]|nr:hypothetical protein [Bacillota bacterium]